MPKPIFIVKYPSYLSQKDMKDILITTKETFDDIRKEYHLLIIQGTHTTHNIEFEMFSSRNINEIDLDVLKEKINSSFNK